MSSVLNETNLKNFIHLKRKLFAEYTFVYHINDGYSVKELSSFHSKHQLLFKKISNKAKQLNLMFVDSAFSIILADVALEVFLNNISSFPQYTSSKKGSFISNMEFDNEYLKYKFKSFIYHLLFSNIASEEICKGVIEADRIFYLKHQNEEIEYYTIYERNKLQELLFSKMILEINVGKSSITKDEANICMRVFY